LETCRLQPVWYVCTFLQAECTERSSSKDQN
jgi:hypothetical protein